MIHAPLEVGSKLLLHPSLLRPPSGLLGKLKEKGSFSCDASSGNEEAAHVCTGLSCSSLLSRPFLLSGALQV
jgi:hypothetical protein